MVFKQKINHKSCFLAVTGAYYFVVVVVVVVIVIVVVVVAVVVICDLPYLCLYRDGVCHQNITL